MGEMSAKNSCTFFLIIDFSSLWSTPNSVSTNPRKRERDGMGREGERERKR